MTMSISFHENLDFSETNISYDDVSTVGKVRNFSPKIDEVHLFAEKLRLPQFKNHTSRPRLNELLVKFSEQIGATLVTGRAGTGKTTMAADFARKYKRVAYYRVESADGDWNVFSSYFAESLKKAGLEPQNFADEAEISVFIENLLAPNDAGEDSVLIILDDVHYIFDAPWFTDFFNSLLHLLNDKTHLLLLSRSSPAFPLWRLRSKQVLGVIDEELLLFNEDETKKFLAGYKLKRKNAEEVCEKSFGRIAKLKSLVESSSGKRTQ